MPALGFGRPAGGARGPRLWRQHHGREAAAAALARLRAHQALLHQHAQQRLPPLLGARHARACARPAPAHASRRAGAGAPAGWAPLSRQRSREASAGALACPCSQHSGPVTASTRQPPSGACGPTGRCCSASRQAFAKVQEEHGRKQRGRADRAGARRPARRRPASRAPCRGRASRAAARPAWPRRSARAARRPPPAAGPPPAPGRARPRRPPRAARSCRSRPCARAALCGQVQLRSITVVCLGPPGPGARSASLPAVHAARLAQLPGGAQGSARGASATPPRPCQHLS